KWPIADGKLSARFSRPSSLPELLQKQDTKNLRWNSPNCRKRTPSGCFGSGRSARRARKAPEIFAACETSDCIKWLMETEKAGASILNAEYAFTSWRSEERR